MGILRSGRFRIDPRSEGMEKKRQSAMITTGETVLHANLLTATGQRLTPTGKISHAKTRVYTQRYRKEWEQMPDFKGTSRYCPSLSLIVRLVLFIGQTEITYFQYYTRCIVPRWTRDMYTIVVAASLCHGLKQ